MRKCCVQELCFSSVCQASVEIVRGKSLWCESFNHFADILSSRCMGLRPGFKSHSAPSLCAVPTYRLKLGYFDGYSMGGQHQICNAELHVRFAAANLCLTEISPGCPAVHVILRLLRFERGRELLLTETTAGVFKAQLGRACQSDMGFWVGNFHQLSNEDSSFRMLIFTNWREVQPLLIFNDQFLYAAYKYRFCSWYLYIPNLAFTVPSHM